MKPEILNSTDHIHRFNHHWERGADPINICSTRSYDKTYSHFITVVRRGYTFQPHVPTQIWSPNFTTMFSHPDDKAILPQVWLYERRSTKNEAVMLAERVQWSPDTLASHCMVTVVLSWRHSASQTLKCWHMSKVSCWPLCNLLPVVAISHQVYTGDGFPSDVHLRISPCSGSDSLLLIRVILTCEGPSKQPANRKRSRLNCSDWTNFNSYTHDKLIH